MVAVEVFIDSAVSRAMNRAVPSMTPGEFHDQYCIEARAECRLASYCGHAKPGVRGSTCLTRFGSRQESSFFMLD